MRCLAGGNDVATALWLAVVLAWDLEPSSHRVSGSDKWVYSCDGSGEKRCKQIAGVHDRWGALDVCQELSGLAMTFSGLTILHWSFWLRISQWHL